MEFEPALPNPPSSLTRRLSVVAAREHGVGPEQLALIGWSRDPGFGNRWIFDPSTGAILADAEFIYGGKAAGYPTVPDGTPYRETVHLKTAIVGTVR